jgi:hypothetical protein
MRRTAESAGGSFQIRRLRVRRRRVHTSDTRMQGPQPHDPDWEHWPGRPTGEEGMRSRLRSLFVPTDAGDAIAELIAEHSRELETRAAELRAAVAELEQREARARELHARVEQVLREGAAELDVRHSDLSVRASELDRREAAVAEAERRAEDRARELGAVELKGAALERREQVVRERKQALERRAQTVGEREDELVRATDRFAQAGADGTDDADVPESAHVILAVDNGYRLLERDGAAPAAGETLELDGQAHRCVRVTASPYPHDRRRCAVVERVPPPEL